MISYPGAKSSPSSRSSRAYSPAPLDTLASKLHTQLELESQAFLLQCRSPVNRQVGPEAIRLYKELNSVKARRYRKVEELRRLKERLGYEHSEGISSELKPEEQRQEETLQTRFTFLVSSLKTLTNQLILEERATESLKEMLEKVTKAQLLMRQRTTELIAIRSTMNRHLASAITMRDRAAAQLAETHSEHRQMTREMAAVQQKFRKDVGKKTAVVTRIVTERETILDRICSGVSEKVAKEEKEIGLLQRLQTEVKRRSSVAKDLQKAEADKAVFSQQFGVIEDILAQEGCPVACRAGLSSGAVSAIVEQFNVFQVVQGSLSSRYSQLAEELTAREKQLKDLQGLFESLKEQHLPSKRSVEEQEKVRFRPAIGTEQLGVHLYAGVITLLGRLLAARDWIEENTARSAWSEVWQRVRNAVKGFKRKEKEPAPELIRSRKRYLTISNPLRSLSESPERPKPSFPQSPASEFNQFIPLSASTIHHFLQKAIVSSEDKLAISFLFECDRVVKYFVDEEMLGSVLACAHVSETLLGKAHFALKTGLRELVNLAEISLRDFSQKDESQREEIGEIQQEIPVRKFATLRKDTRRATDKSLFRPVPQTASPNLPSPSKKSTFRNSLSSDKSLVWDQEAIEDLHIREERAKARNSPISQSPKRPEGSMSASRLAKDENPYSERKRLFIREFRLMQRKLSEVKLSEQRSLKSRSPPASPGYRTFQLLPWLSSQPSSRSGTARARASHSPGLSS